MPDTVKHADRQVKALRPGDVLFGSGATVVSVREVPRSWYCVVVTTHPKRGRREARWHKTTHVGIVA